MDGGEGGEGGINGKNKFEEKIPVGNKFNIPLKTNLNSNMVEFGKLSDRRKACWLGRGLTVYVNEYGKRQVSWDSVKGGKQAGKWVISNIAHNKNMGLGPIKPKHCWVIKNPFWARVCQAHLILRLERVPLVDQGLWRLLTRMGSLR